MRLAGEDELHRALRIGQEAQQPFRIVQQQVGPLVGGEAARKAQRQRIAGRTGASRLPTSSGDAPDAANCRANRSRAYSTSALRLALRNCHRAGVGDAANVLLQRFRRPQPASFAAGLRPQIVGRSRIPGRHVHAVGDMSDRHFVLRPPRKERLKDAAGSPRRAGGSRH